MAQPARSSLCCSGFTIRRKSCSSAPSSPKFTRALAAKTFDLTNTPSRLSEKKSRSRELLRSFHAELFDEERPAVGGFFDDFRGRLARAVTGFGFDPNQSRFVATLRRLKRGGEFETVRRHNAIVVIVGVGLVGR